MTTTTATRKGKAAAYGGIGSAAGRHQRPIGTANRIRSITGEAVTMQKGLGSDGDAAAGGGNAANRGADRGAANINPGDQTAAVHCENAWVATNPVGGVARCQQNTCASLRKRY